MSTFHSLLKSINRTVFTCNIVFAICAIIAVGLAVPKDSFRFFVVTVDGYNIKDYDQQQLIDVLEDKYKWDLKLTGMDRTIEIPNSIGLEIEDTVKNAYDTHFKSVSYEIILDEASMDAIAEDAVAQAKIAMDNLNTNHDIMEFDEEKDEFVFRDMVVAPVINEDVVKKDIKNALINKEFVKTIELTYSKEAVITSAKDYELIGEYTTKAVVNQNRNANISLACATVNGTILLPGQQFSYNETLGKRTKEKGYKEAGAYLDGQHVVQYGGGICQLSSTIYNAIFAANLQVDDRKGHTFSPTYVTPGQDATVSYPTPDFVFTNNTDYPVGLSCHFEDQIVTVKVYGVRTLEPGVKRYMTATKIAVLDPPATIYQANPDVPWGQQIVTSNPINGSKWATYEVLEKDGEVISKTFIYNTSYRGEAAVVQVHGE